MSTSAAPTVPADVPTTGPNLRSRGEKPPVEPVAATQHTPEGAKAFAEFFIKTIDWAYATTSTTYMRHYFSPSCIGCTSIAKAIDGAARQERRFIGDRFEIKATSIDNGTPTAAELSAIVRFSVTSAEVVDRRGRYVTAAPALTNYQERVDLRWQAGTWIVAELVVTR